MNLLEYLSRLFHNLSELGGFLDRFPLQQVCQNFVTRCSTLFVNGQEDIVEVSGANPGLGPLILRPLTDYLEPTWGENFNYGSMFLLLPSYLLWKDIFLLRPQEFNFPYLAIEEWSQNVLGFNQQQLEYECGEISGAIATRNIKEIFCFFMGSLLLQGRELNYEQMGHLANLCLNEGININHIPSHYSRGHDRIDIATLIFDGFYEKDLLVPNLLNHEEEIIRSVFHNLRRLGFIE